MSPRASKICSEPNCTALTGANARCPKHARKAWDGPRTASAKRTGRRSWRLLRARVLCRDLSLCQIGLDGCTVTATEVHHLRECADGGSDAMANLCAICANCHAKITAANASAKSHRGSRRGDGGRPSTDPPADHAAPSDSTAADREPGGRPSTDTPAHRERGGDRSRIPRTINARY
jgi:5-methylcytosine-specific restriction endonuclease McrA